MPQIKLNLNLYLVALSYLVVTVLLRWRLTPNIGIALYAAGAIIGLHLFEVVEKVVIKGPSPLRNTITYIVVSILTLFVLTSTGNPLGKGVVLFLNLYLIVAMRKELHEKQSLASWFGNQPAYASNEFGQKCIYAVYFIFAVETLLFILV